jgi:hypothetical protein
MLVCGVPLSFLDSLRFALKSEVVTKLWKKEFETPGNTDPLTTGSVTGYSG